LAGTRRIPFLAVKQLIKGDWNRGICSNSCQRVFHWCPNASGRT
jgi:hypothetical protein